MSRRKITACLLLALAFSVVGMGFAAQSNLKLAHILMAAAAAGSLIQISLIVNLEYWRDLSTADDPAVKAVDAAKRNAILIASAYAWGGIALAVVYYATRLYWYHAWQYAAGMGLIAAGVFAYSYLVGRPDSILQQPAALRLAEAATALQILAAAAGLGFLLGTGKLMTRKDDWAANDVFLLGGLAIVVLSIHAVFAQRRLRRNAHD